MASFQAKIGWKMMRQRENKNSPSVSSLPDASHKIPKKQQKNLKKYHYWFFSMQNTQEKGKKDRI